MFQKKEKGTIKTVWISQNNHIIRKSKLEFSNGKVFEYDYELKFDITKSIDIELPNISDYKILDNETGEIILDNSKATRTRNIKV